MSAAMAAERVFEAELGRTLRLGHLAAAHTLIGEFGVSLGLLDEAILTVEKMQERLFEAELHRLRGEVLLGLGMTGEGEVALLRALTVATNQDARMWELRAAVSLARLRRDQDRRAEAFDFLAPLYGWFAEGFDTPDLEEARAVLDELR